MLSHLNVRENVTHKGNGDIKQPRIVCVDSFHANFEKKLHKVNRCSFSYSESTLFL